ncbi:MAG TPA: zf-HC2 domain-containing protein [Thermoanaerobaculia bacterium]|nr:zf-HC2 domain-containing protein [Thermoanaerobaculia bacterium]
MRCRDVEALLPLFAGADLDARTAAAVGEHVALCPRCSADSEALRGTLLFLAESPEPPLDDAFHLDVRRDVLHRLRAEPRSRRYPTFLLAAAAALLLALALTRRAPRPAPIAGPPTPPPATPAPVAIAAGAPATPASPRGASAKRRLPARGRRPSATLPAVHVTRIEIQTPNPHVRIVWLASASPRADATTD